jgi:hypothetical protein
MIPTLKGLAKTFSSPRKISISPSGQYTRFADYPEKGYQTTFKGGDILIHHGDFLVQESLNHRRTFAGLAKLRSWSSMDAAYFFGYALWHYHSVPFLLREARFIKHCQAYHNGRSLLGIEVEFLSKVPTHSSRQRYFFDEEGLIRRNDYVANIVGPFARGAHFWNRFENHNGLPVATQRVVEARCGRWATGIPVLKAQLKNIRIKELAGLE